MTVALFCCPFVKNFGCLTINMEQKKGGESYGLLEKQYLTATNPTQLASFAVGKGLLYGKAVSIVVFSQIPLG